MLLKTLKGFKIFYIMNFSFIRNLFKKNKLIMTLLVKDEIDIIEENIKFHLKKGVDFIIATDNGSIDGTRDVLIKYQKKGFLHLIDDSSKECTQSELVNKMGIIASERYRANYLFHCDADEFWCPKYGNIKGIFFKNKSVDVMNVDIVNVVLDDKDGKEKFPLDAKYAVINPIISSDVVKESVEKGLFTFDYSKKVLINLENKFPLVRNGNHGVYDKNDFVHKNIDNIIIYHFPVRSKEQFLAKIRKRFFNLNRIDEGEYFQHRRWKMAVKDGFLDKEYKKLTMNNPYLKELLVAGNISEFDFFRDLIYK